MEKASKLVTLLNCEDRKAAKKVDAAAGHTHQRLHYLWSEKYVDTYFDVLNTRRSIPTAGLAAGWYVSMPLRQSGARVFLYTRRNSVFFFFLFLMAAGRDKKYNNDTPGPRLYIGV